MKGSFVRFLVRLLLASAVVALLFIVVRYADHLSQLSSASTGTSVARTGGAGTGRYVLAASDKSIVPVTTGVDDEASRSKATNRVLHSPTTTSEEHSTQSPSDAQGPHGLPVSPADQASSQSPGGTRQVPGLLYIELVIVPFLHPNVSNMTRLTWRHNEYKTALQRNLNHDLVSHVHLLTTDIQESKNFFSDMANEEKLILVEVERIDYMRDPFDYISQHLVGKDVVYANADIYLGDGFDRVDPLVMSRKKIMYALTRRVAQEDKCKSYSGRDGCTENRYVGSHDTFLFHLSEPIPESHLKELDFHQGSWGQENVLMWLFKNKLNYCLLNPCTVLESFHLHCSEVRGKNRRVRVNTHGKSGTASFTTKLVC